MRLLLEGLHLVTFNPQNITPEALDYIEKLEITVMRAGKAIRQARDIIDHLEQENREYLNSMMLMGDVIEEQERVIRLAEDCL